MMCGNDLTALVGESIDADDANDSSIGVFVLLTGPFDDHSIVVRIVPIA